MSGCSESRKKEELIQKYIRKGHSRRGASILADMELRGDPRLKKK
jgi:hypothetical protein